MPLSRFTLFLASVSVLVTAAALAAQVSGPTSGELTVQLVQGLDSTMDPRGISQGIVMKSTDKSIPNRSTVMVGLGSDSASGVYTAQLLSITIGGQTIRLASSQVAPGINMPAWMTKGSKVTYSGPHVFLPAQTWVKFTLTEPPATAARQSASASPKTPAPNVWQVTQVDEIKSPGNVIKQTGTMLKGSVTVKGRTGDAWLVMHCDFPTSDYPALLPLEVILSPALAGQFPSAPGAASMDISEVAKSQLGSASSIAVNANGQDWTSGTRYHVFYNLADMKDIIAASGQTLQLTLQAPVTFALPIDNEPVRQIMDSCIQRSESEAAKAQARVLASCPSRPNLILNGVSVKLTATGKEILGDSDEMGDMETWSLPAPVRGKPIRNTVLTCSYVKGDASHPVDKVEVPIPPTARSCNFTSQTNAARNTATCVGAAPK